MNPERPGGPASRSGAVREGLEKRDRLEHPVLTPGDRVYAVGAQDGGFADASGEAQERWGVWDHPIKLLSGFRLAVSAGAAPAGLERAEVCRVGPGTTEFEYRLDGLGSGPLEVTRRDFAPDGLEGLVVAVELRGGRPGARLELAARFEAELRPAWLGEEAGMHDGPDRAEQRAELGAAVFLDGANPWAAAVGASAGPSWVRLENGGPAAAASLGFALTLDAEGRAGLHLFVAGSAEGEAAALATLERLRADPGGLLAVKTARYRRVLGLSRLESPDRRVNEAHAWARLNCEMLAREVPGIGRGAGAGLPTYPHWFGIDTAYAAPAMLEAGLFELTLDTLRLLKRQSERANPLEPGRVIHELSTTGVVPHRGNLVETPAFVRAAHAAWLWTGDRAFLEEVYPFCKRGLLEHTLGRRDPDGDLCPSGESLTETLEMHAGFECLDVAVYTWEALGRLADMAVAAGDGDVVPLLEARAEELGRRLREEWWLEDEGLFADVRASVREVRDVLGRLDAMAAASGAPPHVLEQVAEAHRLLDPLLARRAGQDEAADLPWLLRHGILVCPVEAGLALPEQAARVLARLASSELSGPWGPYIHPDRPSSMSIGAGLLALAEARYGRVDRALGEVERLASALTLYMPGAIAEGLPDYWNPVQLWSALGLVAPVAEVFFGLAPRAAERRLRAVPNLPEAWSQASLHDLRVGEARFSLTAGRRPDERSLRLRGDTPGYRLEVGAFVPEGAAVRSVELSGRPARWRLERTLAGRSVVCDAEGEADLTVRLG